MSDEPAARVGDEVDHLAAPASPGVGSTNVSVNDKPAWRAHLDTHDCEDTKPIAHVCEIAQFGSHTVLINDEMAIRRGDFLLGSQLPNEVLVGSPDVSIGNPLNGLAALIAGYCAEFCALMKNWTNLTRDEQIAALKKLTNDQLEKIGVPAIDFELVEEGLSGSFSMWDWKMNVGPGLVPARALTAAERSELSKTLLHEARHAEQAWIMGRDLAVDNDAGAIQSSTGLPEDIANAVATQPLASAFGKTKFRSLFGDWRSYRQQVFADRRAGVAGSYERYRTLPEEHDAWEVDDLTVCDCKDC